MANLVVVDDDYAQRTWLEAILRAEGHVVHGLETGESLLEHVEHAAADLILLDVLLPGESGMDVLKKLRGLPQTARVPVILLTVLQNPRDARAGADDYLVKPVTARRVAQAVADRLRVGPRPLAPA